MVQCKFHQWGESRAPATSCAHAGLHTYLTRTHVCMSSSQTDVYTPEHANSRGVALVRSLQGRGGHDKQEGRDQRGHHPAQPLGLLKMVPPALREWGLGGVGTASGAGWVLRYHKSWSVAVPYSSNAHGAGTGVSPTIPHCVVSLTRPPSYHSWAD